MFDFIAVLSDIEIGVSSRLGYGWDDVAKREYIEHSNVSTEAEK